jgi:hypothetical protein
MSDVSLLASNLPVGIGGLWGCQTYYIAGVSCMHGHATFDTDTSTTTVKNSIACQEIGHATGLQHTTISTEYSCMRSDTNAYVLFSPHDKSHINGRY